jgi:DNA-binding LytR/AlgR family response regulator
MRVTALIAEDEGMQRRALSRLLSESWPELEIVAECADGPSAIAALQAHRPTVAFLDIRMGGATGLQVAQHAMTLSHVVFTTAYEQHAIEAFEVGAFDYLLKPVTPDRLNQTLQRLKTRLSETPGDIRSVVEELRRDLRASRETGIPWITASVGHTIKLIASQDVLFFQAGDKCTRVVSRTDDAQIRTSLKELLAALNPDEFWQIHRSVIVRVSAIRSVRRNELGRLEVALKGSDEVLPVSQPFHYRFRGM